MSSDDEFGGDVHMDKLTFDMLSWPSSEKSGHEEPGHEEPGHEEPVSEFKMPDEDELDIDAGMSMPTILDDEEGVHATVDMSDEGQFGDDVHLNMLTIFT